MIENIDNSSEEITPPLPKGFKAIKKSEVAPPLPEGFNPIKKKASTDSTSTTTNSKLALEPKIGSSDGVGFPKIDTNSVAPGMGDQPKIGDKPVKVKTAIKPSITPAKEEEDFWGYLGENLSTGLATVSKSFYDAPGLVYDTFAAVTNPVAELLGADKTKLASSDKLANDLGIKNIPSEILKKKIAISNEKINAYSAKNGGDAWQAATDGNYGGAAKLVIGTTVQSLPIMVIAMASGGSGAAMTAIGLSTASTKNAQLKEENPEMDLGTRVLNANTSGIIEAVTGHLFTGASGAVMKKILAEKGVEAGSKIISKSFKTTIQNSIEKNPLVSAFGEVVEESAVEFGNQLNDMSSGIRTEFDFHAIKNAGLSATGMGGVQTIGVYGAKGYVKAKAYNKLKATNREVFKLRNEIENGNLSDENKALLSIRADRLEGENKKLLGTEIEKAKALPTEAKTELNALNKEFEDLKSKFDNIDDADDIPDNLKSAMKEEIRLQASKNQKRKTEILSQNDGLEINNDFSKFQGVEPDFDLENGKIASLPLKEQDRLNDLALQKLTGGDMSIEVTREQVSQTANEIYASEQAPVVETPVAETPKAEEVVTPEVVAENVEGQGVSNEAVNNSAVKDESHLVVTSSVKTNLEEGRKKQVVEIDENGNQTIKEVDFTKEDASLELDRLELLAKKGKLTPEEFQRSYFGQSVDMVTFQQVSENIKNDAVSFIDKIKQSFENESTPETNPPTNGDVQPGIQPVGESGVAKPETPAKESVPSPVDSGKSKGDVEVKKENITIEKNNVILQNGTTTTNEVQPESTGNGGTGRATISKTAPLQGAPTVQGATGPDSGLISVAEKYANDNGIDLKRQGEYVKVDEDRAKRIANAYEEMANDPQNPKVKEAYAELIRQTRAQYQALVDAGYEFWFIDLNNPANIEYISSPFNAMRDLRQQKKMGVFPTEEGFGSNEGVDVSENPLLEDTGLMWAVGGLNGEMKPVTANDLFRAVHDAFGHGLEGSGFRAQGEENAWQAHSRLYTGTAIGAMTSETRGQNSWVNYGPNGEANRTASAEDTVFADQKVGLMPEFTWIEGRASDMIPEIETTEVSDLDHAKDQIEKGVLQWNGDTGAERVKLGISWADIRKGELDIKRGKENTVPAKRLIEALKTAKEKGGYEYTQGKGGITNEQFVSLEDIQKANNEYQLTDAEQKQVRENEFESARKYDEDFNSLSEKEQIEILENYENREDNSGTPVADSGQPQSKNDVSKGKEGEGAKPAAKKTAAERIAINNANVDDFKNALKGIDNIFGIKIKVDDIDGLNSNGIDIIDVIANIVKQAMAAEIKMDEAISKTIEHLKKSMDFDVDVNAIKERINPKQTESEKKADNDFKSKKGKKSLLGRLIEGGNPDNITDALKELGGDYDIRNQKDANAEAIAFIDKVGASEALKAVKDGLVTNSDVKMLIYDEALTRLKTEISDEINRNPEDREALIKKFQEVSDDFDNAVRDAGQGLAILNYIYNKNQTLKYNLKKQIADWKRNDPNREIPAEMKARMEELDKKLKNVEERTKEAEARAKVAEDELAIKNIQEDIERKNQAAKKNKSGLTPKEQLEKAVLRKEFYGAFNDVTRVATLLADPKFRRYLGLVFKTAKGDLANFSNEILSNLGKEAQKYLPELFKEASAEAKSKKQKSVKTEDEIYQEKLDAKIEAVKKKISDLENNIQKDVLGKNSIWGPELSKQQTILKKLREDRNTKQKEIETSSPSIKIGKDGKIKIPAKLLRDYVEAGETDIDVISQLIKDDLGDEFPDVDLIDIRDALTGYGKQINPNSDEITAQVNKLKEYGRLLSAYNDVMNGKMPLKSGLKREKPETRSRQLRRDINRLAKELNIEPIDLETQWASAIEKVKSQLENQIEDLNQQIAKGEKRKIERTSIKLDAEAEALKATRYALKEHLDNLVGKPELTEEQKITRAEKALKNSIKKIQEELDTNNLEFKEKPTPVNSAKIESLKAQKKALLETKKQLREQAGIIEAQRLKTAKTRIQGQIEDLKARIKNNDFSKKEVKPILADNELNSLRAEKEALYEHYDKLKYIQDQENRSTTRKFIDITLEGLALGRAIKASLDLGLIGIQLRGFTYAELWRNPKDLGKKFIKMLGAIGSQSKTSKAMSTLIGHPLYGLSKKLDIGVTQPDLRNEVREEIASGNLLHVAWNLPITIAKLAGKQDFTSKKTKSIGDTFIDGLKTQFNKISQKYQLPITAKEKFSREEQLENINIFEAIERGLSTYGNQLRFEEFVRGVDRLRAEGKDEINHLEDYQLLASYIRTFSGRANPASFKMNQKALNVFFFSFKNAASVFQQLNPVYYLHQHLNSTDFKNGNYTKIPVANKMAMATMFKSVASTAATMLFLVAGYNAFKDDDEEEMTIEKDPRSSDFGKLKVGDLRYDPWGGYIPLITLIARIKTEEIKKPDGTIYKMGEERNGVKDRGDATVRFIINKESPSFAMFHHYMTSVDKVDKITGEVSRVNHFGKKLTDDDVYSMWPIFLGSVKDAAKEDAGGYESFLTAYSILGLGNVQKYSSKVATPEDDFRDVMEKRKMKSELSTPDKTKGKVENRVSSAEGKIKEIERMKIAQKLNLTYYTSSGIEVDVSDRDFSKGEAGIEAAKNNIAKTKARYGIKDKK